MTPRDETHATVLAPASPGIAHLISTAVALSLGISMAAAAMLVAAGIWLERLNLN